MDCSVFWTGGTVISEDLLVLVVWHVWKLAAETHYDNTILFLQLLGRGSDIHSTCPPSGCAHLINVNIHFECFFSCREATWELTTQWRAGLL